MNPYLLSYHSLVEKYFLWIVSGISILLMIVGMAQIWISIGQAVSLEISGLSSGVGLHNISLVGDLINASIVQGNNTTWAINATGASA